MINASWGAYIAFIGQYLLIVVLFFIFARFYLKNYNLGGKRAIIYNVVLFIITLLFIIEFGFSWFLIKNMYYGFVFLGVFPLGHVIILSITMILSYLLLKAVITQKDEKIFRIIFAILVLVVFYIALGMIGMIMVDIAGINDRVEEFVTHIVTFILYAILIYFAKKRPKYLS